MNSQLQLAKETLFGESGLRASDFKLFPGTARDATAEKIAAEINSIIGRIESGDFDVLESVDD